MSRLVTLKSRLGLESMMSGLEAMMSRLGRFGPRSSSAKVYTSELRRNLCRRFATTT